MDRQFDLLDELHAWAGLIAITNDFHFTRASYKQKEGHSTMSLYICCHRYNRFRGQLYDLDSAARARSRTRAYGRLFMIIRYFVNNRRKAIEAESASWC